MANSIFEDRVFTRRYLPRGNALLLLGDATKTTLRGRIRDLFRLVSPANDFGELPPILVDPGHLPTPDAPPIHAKVSTQVLLGRLGTTWRMLGANRQAETERDSDNREKAYKLLGMVAAIVNLCDPESRANPFALTFTQMGIVAIHTMMQEMHGSAQELQGEHQRVREAYALLRDAFGRASFEVETGE